MWKKWVISFGGLGLLPAMPGTYASLAAAVIFYLVCRGLGLWACPAMLGLTLLMAGLAMAVCPWAQETYRTADPRTFVLDEVVGQWLTLLFVPLAANPLGHVVASFFLFRAFDVAKPYPIRAVERLPGGWGVILDDVVAGVYANGSLWLLMLATRLLIGPA